MKKYVKLKLPSFEAAVKVLSASAGGHASLRQASGGRKNLIVGPSCSQMRKGGMHHGVERCFAAARRYWRHSWNHFQDLMGYLSRNP